MGTVARHERGEHEAERSQAVADEGSTPPAVPFRPPAHAPLARNEEGVVERLIVVQIIALEEEPDHHAWLERHGIQREDGELLSGSVAGHAEIGHGLAHPVLQVLGHDLIVRSIVAFHVGVADQDDRRPGELSGIAVATPVVGHGDPIRPGRRQSPRRLEVAARPRRRSRVGSVPEAQIGIGHIVLLLSRQPPEHELPVNEPDGGRPFEQGQDRDEANGQGRRVQEGLPGSGARVDDGPHRGDVREGQGQHEQRVGDGGRSHRGDPRNEGEGSPQENHRTQPRSPPQGPPHPWPGCPAIGFGDAVWVTHASSRTVLGMPIARVVDPPRPFVRGTCPTLRRRSVRGSFLPEESRYWPGSSRRVMRCP
jgi:hypothetical protein